MPHLEIALLGLPIIKIDGNPMDSDRRKVTALFAYLVVTGGTYTREQLATLFWPEFERESSLAYLRRTLWELNRTLGKTWLQTERDLIRFNATSDFWLDISAFTGLLAQYRDAKRQHGEGLPFLETATALYRGDFLLGFSVPDSAGFDEWQFFQAEALRREFAWALEKLVEEYEQRRKYTLALPAAHRWLTLDSLNETAHCALMRVYAEMEDRAAAIRQYETCVQVLKTELDVPPQPETTALYEKILRGEFRDAPEPESILPPPPAPAVNRLPVPSTPFIGRRTELEQIKSLILSPACRLLTLIGPGGMGKTRLSIQAVSESASVFSEGAFFVPLDSLNPGASLVPAVARALEFYFYMGEERPRQQLLDCFRGKQMLLILDNFEHLIHPENLELLTDLLVAAPGVKLVVTSRTRLGLQGEYVFSVAGLDLPPKQIVSSTKLPDDYVKSFSALELFVARARRVQPGFQLTRENLPAVNQICRLVEGMPLGIELASAWLELMSPQDIAAEITHNLDFLETSLKDIPARQRSLRALFESSWKYLDIQEREVFLKMSVFQGSFSREAAQVVSGASLRSLLELVNKSWLQVDARELSLNEGRLHLHDLLRQYANELLKATPTTWKSAKDQHGTYFAEFAMRQGRAMRGAGQVNALNAIATEFETNLRVTWQWFVEQGNFFALVQQMLPAMFPFCLIRSLCPELIPLVKEARQAIEKNLNADHWLYWAIFLTVENHMEIRYGLLEDHPREKLAKVWKVVQERQLAPEMGGWFVFLARDYAYEIAFAEGKQQLSIAVARLRERVQAQKVDPYALGWNLMILGRMTMKETPQDAEQYLTEALRIFQETGVSYEQALTLLSLGDTSWRRKRSVSESIQFFQAARQFFEQVDDPFGVATIWRVLGEIYLQTKDFEQAFIAFKEQGMVYERIGNRPPPSGSGTFFGSREVG
ncbi:MAG TPA: BTAD domain-containing putative transcriptional regulator [Anaerolineales bacterium]|nr:BTAD domain-containing putative transcriptional regulator [Anaerolineales bacterium]